MTALATTGRAAGGRSTVSLDGTWQIADGKSAESIPTAFEHTAPVPGLANLARPPFADVDAFTSRENLANRIRSKLSPASWLKQYWKGKVDQDRDYFWYRKTFHAPARRAVALLKINKAQFGTAVWLNGRKLGEYAGCFSASYFPLDRAIRWDDENTLVVRIGAHPAVLPDNYPTGSDFEKNKWTPGIYDSVVADFLRQSGDRDAPGCAAHRDGRGRGADEVEEPRRRAGHGHRWRTPSRRGRAGNRLPLRRPQPVVLEPGEEQVLTQAIKIPAAHLWSPEDPFLYVVESTTRRRLADDPLRHARVPSRPGHETGLSQRQGLLSARLEYHAASLLRRSALPRLALGREAGSASCCGDLPKKMHWNYFRFCIGPVPDHWLDIATRWDC